MDGYSEDFKKWMDRNGFTPATLAPLIKKEPGTIKQWRSRGLPESSSVRAHVSNFMEQWRDDQVEALRTKGSISLEVDMETFNAWNQEAMNQGKLISDWIKDTLNALETQDMREVAKKIVSKSKEKP